MFYLDHDHGHELECFVHLCWNCQYFQVQTSFNLSILNYIPHHPRKTLLSLSQFHVLGCLFAPCIGLTGNTMRQGLLGRLGHFPLS